MPLKSLRFVVLLSAAVLALASVAIYWTDWRTTVYPGDQESAPDPGFEPIGASAAADSAPNAGARGDSAVSDHSPSRLELLTPAAILNGNGPFVDRLETASSTYGIHDYRVRRALMYVRRLCASPDPAGSLALPMPDPSRDWVFESIAELCDGMESLQVDESLPAVGEPESLFSIDRSQGRDAAVAAAEELMARELDPVLVYEAALFAWEVGRSPSPASMGVNPEAVGPAEQMAALSEAAMLTACYQLDGCRPTSWQTLEFCAHFGCAPGSNFHQALRAHHSEQRMRLIEGYARWIQGFRDR